MLRTTLSGRHAWQARGFTILLVLEGSCTVATAQEEIPLRQFDRNVVSHGQAPVILTAPDRAVLFECLRRGTPDI